ncbi:MAG: hypothetical protein N2C13_01470 [Chloroflexota bacterium]
MACSLSDIPILDSKQPPDSPAAVDSKSPSVQSSSLPEELIVTETVEPTIEAVPVDPVCVQPASPEPLPLVAFEEYPNIFLEFINAGGPAASLQSNLEELNIANDAPTVFEADLTGDKKNDLVVSFIEPDPQSFPPVGALLIYICLGDKYTLAHIEYAGEILSAPRMLYVQDLNADGKVDVLYSSSTCGAHTCFEDTNILSWNGTDFDKRIDEGTQDLPFPNLQITDYDRDGIYSIEMTSGGYGSVGAGPQRDQTNIWDYNPISAKWERSNIILGTSLYRIHLLHDADSAVRNQDYEVAIVLYREVINNPELLDWMDRDNEMLQLSAYAQFKLLVVYILQGNTSQAQIHFNEINALYLTNSPQRSYLDMAAVFLTAFHQSGDFEIACQEAHQYAAQHAAQILSPLGSQTYGYANPDYSPLDICP